jgi:hypothetical protein
MFHIVQGGCVRTEKNLTRQIVIQKIEMKGKEKMIYWRDYYIMWQWKRPSRSGLDDQPSI